MKKILLSLAVVGAMFSSCDKVTPVPEDGGTDSQTEQPQEPVPPEEPEQPQEPEEPLKPAELLAALQGNWIALSVDEKNGEEIVKHEDFTLGQQSVPTLTIEGETVTMGLVQTEVLAIEKNAASLVFVSIDDKKILKYTDETSATVTLEATKDGQLKVTSSSSSETLVRHYLYAKTDLTLKKAPVDLAKNGTANCYIVSEPGEYFFPADVKGNGSTAVIAGSTSPELTGVVSAEIFYENYPMPENTVFEAELVPQTVLWKIWMDQNKIHFSTAHPFHEGNVLIAGKNASGEVLWTWHIWVTDQPEELTYANGAGITMDRNLGATEVTPDHDFALARGFSYQWGRKDPMMPIKTPLQSIVSSYLQIIESQYDIPSVNSKDIADGLEYSIAHPTTFITSNSSGKDHKTFFPGWYRMGEVEARIRLWAAEKTIYDPCPPGWRVPDGGPEGIWAKAGLSNGTIETTTSCGYLMPASICGKDNWFCGNNQLSEGGFANVHASVFLTVTDYSTPTITGKYCMMINHSDKKIDYNTYLMNGTSGYIRCQKVN